MKPRKQKRSRSKNTDFRTRWDHYFVQWCVHWLPTLHLIVKKKPRFSQLPLEADIIIITAQSQGSWQFHPLWQHLSHYSVIEFKSVHDAFKVQDFGTLMAYVGLTRRKYKLTATTEVAGWLIVSTINKALVDVLMAYQLTLKPLLPGFHHVHTGLFPLFIVEYDLLPNEDTFCELKTFMGQGEGLLKAMDLATEKWSDSPLYEEYITIITAIHEEETEAVLKVRKQERKNLRKVMETGLALMGDEADELEFVRRKLQQGADLNKLATARAMKTKGFEPSIIAELTGLALEEIAAL